MIANIILIIYFLGAIICFGVFAYIGVKNKIHTSLIDILALCVLAFLWPLVVPVIFVERS